MAYGRALTASEWKKAVETLSYNRIAHLPTGDVIIPWVGTWQTTYSLRTDEGNTVLYTGDLERIKNCLLRKDDEQCRASRK